MRVLIIDDDVRLFDLVAEYLTQHDVQVQGARSGGEGLDRLERQIFDAVMLDVMMPGMDGLEVVRRIREKSQVPIVMLTAKGDEADRVVGLELGADDYVTKPFSPRELLARLRAVLRRTHPELTRERLRVSGIEVDVPARTVHVAGRRAELTGIELDILVALMRRAGRVVPREVLLEAAGRGHVHVGERAVDVHISKLRRKLGSDGQPTRLIETVRGLGYVLAKEGAP